MSNLKINSEKDSELITSKCVVIKITSYLKAFQNSFNNSTQLNSSYLIASATFDMHQVN